MSRTVIVDSDIQLRAASARGFWEMWVGGTFVGMYYSLDRARAASRSHYAEACRRKYAHTSLSNG